MIQKQLFTSNNQHHNTPNNVLELVRKFGPITVDPCSNQYSLVNAKISYDGITKDGLIEPWHGIIFVNPPYGRHQIHWIKRCVDVLYRNPDNQIFLLVPARTDTKNFQDWIYPGADKICFIKGRLKFLLNGQEQDPAPFPSLIAYFGKRKNKFTRVFNELGIVK